MRTGEHFSNQDLAKGFAGEVGNLPIPVHGTKTVHDTMTQDIKNLHRASVSQTFPGVNEMVKFLGFERLPSWGVGFW